MHEPVASGQIRFGPFTFDGRSSELFKGTSRIKLPDQSVEILKALLARPGQLITREELRQRLWPDNTFVDFEHGLNAAMRRLRDALGDSADAPRFIETLPRRGYRFRESVTEAAPAPGTGAPTALGGTPETPDGPFGTATASTRTGTSRNPRERIAWMAVAVLGVAVIILGIRVARRAPSSGSADLVLFTIAAPDNATLNTGETAFAVSPDSRHVVFVASSQGVAALWLKPMSAALPVRIAGTEGAHHPFWSPDSRMVGFFAGNKLKAIGIEGGHPDVICDALAGRGGTWNDRNEIVFAPATDSVLMKVALSDRRPVTITTKQEGDTTHRTPAFLPDGRHFLYWAGGGSNPGRVQIGSLDSAQTETLPVPGAGKAEYGAGHVVFLRFGNLMAQRFHPPSRRLSGQAFSIAEGRIASFSVSAAGVLAVEAFRAARLTMIDRLGNQSRVLDEHSFMVALSPDDGFVATSMTIPGPRADIFSVDLGRRTPTRLTVDPSMDFFPVWSPTGQELVFSSTRNGRYQLFRMTRSPGGEQLLPADASPAAQTVAATDWSRNGKYLALTRADPGTPSIWILPLTDGAKPFQYRDTPAALGNAHFSPDGRWLAFSSDESGKQKEVYVAAFPYRGTLKQVSRGGGTQPQWRSDGKELFFFAPDGTLMSAAVTTESEFTANEPRILFRVAVSLTVGSGNEYAATSDGEKFLVNVLDPPPPISVILNSPWTRNP
jgi:Tol biopolymer transport system component/DNA-binding winged helix-turn-helix (wHTH) protein